MTNQFSDLRTINRLAAGNPSALIEESERQYDAQLRRAASDILGAGQRIVMLAGPSGSGKTTTAHLLAGHFTALGACAAVVSLDDFYLNPQDMPLLDDGSPDFESVHSLDLEHLHRCLCDLAQTRRCELPVFDFVKHRMQGETRLLQLGEGDVVLFEGLHALHPLICGRLPDDQLCRVHVCVGRELCMDGETLLTARELRFVRRMLRDHRFRNSTPSNTLSMWKGVVRGEEQYLRPYEHTARITVDSLHDYEPCVFRDPFLELMEQVEPDNPGYCFVSRVGQALSMFEPLPVGRIPPDSLLRDFIGRTEPAV